MLHLLSSRENGTDSPGCLNSAVSTLRARSLDLSKHYDVETVHKGGINSLDIDPVEHRYLLSGGAEGVIGIHDLHNGTGVPRCTHVCVGKIAQDNPCKHQFSVENVQWYPLDSGIFVSSGTDKTLKVWDTNLLTTADEFQFSGIIYSHDISTIATQHSLVAVGYLGNTVKLLDMKSGSAIHTLKGHKKSVVTVKWSTYDEFILATGSQDSKIMLWDIRSSRGSLMVLDQHNGDSSASANSVNTAHDGHVNGLCFTEGGHHLVSVGTDSCLRVWIAATGRNTFVNFGRLANKRRRNVQLAVSHGGWPPLAYVPTSDTMTVVGLNDGYRHLMLRGHYGMVNACVASYQSQFVYSGGADRNILVWTPTQIAGGEIAFEEHLRGEKDGKTVKSFTQRIGAMADTWSSDED